MSTPGLVYAHGFASGPGSAKGRALAGHLKKRGLRLQLLDLRVRDPNHLRLSAMISVVRGAVSRGPVSRLSFVPGASWVAPERHAVAMGSSLGALTVARAAERDKRIIATLLLAPAFRIAERWRRRVGENEWARWRDEGELEFDDHATGGKIHVDFAFIEEAGSIDGDDTPDDLRAHEGFGPRWPDVRVPTVIVHGTRDDVVDPELSRTFAKGRPHVRLVEVDDDHQLLRSIPRIEKELDRLLADLGVA